MEFQSWVAGHLTGGIGNRLFQHAAAAGLAEKWSVPLVFYVPECGPTNHGAFENIFKLFPTVPQITKAVSVERLAEITKERCESLLKEYDLDTVEKRQNTWFLHVRLGDYKILPHHQIDINDYYTKAVKHIPEGARVLLFSDDIEPFGNFLQSFLQQMGIEPTPVFLKDEVESLYVMSQCWGGAVVANSTFSWWGAYFAKRYHPSGYIAVYPSIWGKGLPVATDIVPSWGIRIDNK
jgi:hypothetical protein